MNKESISKVIDQLALQVLEKFFVPGVAVGIIKDGHILHAKGYGVSNIENNIKVDSQTLFSIASTGKSFTSAALALLVDAGKIQWQSKVIDYLPDFKLYDSWVTNEFTIKDLLIHNSGLGIGAGDLMFYPKSKNPKFSRSDIINNLRYLKPETSFRAQFAYDNLLYVVAGEVIAAVSGISYEKFIEKKLFKPLKMKNAIANIAHHDDLKNIASPHIYDLNSIQLVQPDVEPGVEVVTSAAGGLLCSIESILNWHSMLLNKGKLPNGDVLISEKQIKEIFTPQTIKPLENHYKEAFNTHFMSYGLGWTLLDINSYKAAMHTGALHGMVTINLLIPDLNLGIAVYTNQQSDASRLSLMYTVVEAFTSTNKSDWLSELYQREQDELKKDEVSTPVITEANYTPESGIDQYQGTFKDPWFGKVYITKVKDQLYFRAENTERLKGKLVPYKANSFIVRWDDRSLNADAYLNFANNNDGTPDNITMKAISTLTDFSFDFHHLNFDRVQN